MIKLQRLGISKDAAHSLEQQAEINEGKGEVCGLLVGKINRSKMAVAHTLVPLSNLCKRRESFAISLEEFRKIKAEATENGNRLLAFYHSHPHGATQPSFRDLEIPKLLGILSLIVAPTQHKVYIACFGYSNKKIYPVEVIVPID